MGIALRFRPEVFLYAEIPAVCAPGDVGLESDGATLSGQAASIDSVMVFLCGALQQGTAAEAMR